MFLAINIKGYFIYSNRHFEKAKRKFVFWTDFLLCCYAVRLLILCLFNLQCILEKSKSENTANRFLDFFPARFTKSRTVWRTCSHLSRLIYSVEMFEFFITKLLHHRILYWLGCHKDSSIGIILAIQVKCSGFESQPGHIFAQMEKIVNRMNYILISSLY